MKTFSITCLLILLTSICIAQEPKAVITAKETANVGTSVWLKTDGSEGRSFQWRLLPQEANENFTILPIFGGLDADNNPIVNYWGHFEANTKGTYFFIFVATAADKSDIAIHKLTYGQPEPIPPDPDDPNPPTPNVLPVIEKPTGKYYDAIQSVHPLSMNTISKEDCVELTKFYLDFDDLLFRDSQSKLINSMELLRKIHINAGSLMFQRRNIDNKYSGLGTNVDKALTDILTLQTGELTDAKRTDARLLFRALSWSFAEGAKK